MKDLSKAVANPFRKTGALKQQYSYNSNGKIFVSVSYAGSMRTAAALKEDGTQWTALDNPNISKRTRAVLGGIKQAELAELAGVSLDAVKSWESGGTRRREPSEPQVKKLQELINNAVR